MPILHIVSFKAKPEVTAEQFEAAFKAADIQNRMPHLVHNWQWGKNINLAVRPEECKKFEWVMTMVFNTEEDLNAYMPHPEHLEVKKIFGPLLADKFIVDLVI